MRTLTTKTVSSDTTLSGETFLLSDVSRNTARNGSEYIRIKLADSVGELSGNIWSDKIANCDDDSLTKGKVVKVWGKVEMYKESMQVVIHALKAATEDEYDLSDFTVVSEIPVAELWESFEGHVKAISNESLKSLLNHIFKDKELREKYQNHPAAEHVHHAYKHGLLEHVLEMVDLATALAKYYPTADLDLIKVGCIFHDIGKLEELSDDGVSYGRTTPGHLLGHIVLGYEFVSKNAPADFPEDLMLKIKHIILSHHGILEYGSPVVPMTLEAIIVSEVDVTSSRTRQYQSIIRNNADSGEEFTERDRLLGTRIYLK